ncbi:MAG: condensation domain-containing protein, partial [Pseudomonadota bacterium]|nr:condensation domain-containing protein [Pseudomonadota bacterium]
MSVDQIFAELEQIGATVRLEGERLVLCMRRNAIQQGTQVPENLRDRIRRHRAKLIEVLRESSLSEANRPPLRTYPRRGVYPASHAQERLFFLEQLGLVGAAYNIPDAIQLEGRLDIAALERSFCALIRRHETLRTRFEAVDGQAMQRIDALVDFEVPVLDLSALPTPAQEREVRSLGREEALCPFDLQSGALLRVKLLCLSDEKHVMLVTMHHIISDGWSMGVLIREIGALYEAFLRGQSASLPSLPIQYVDYALWQREWLSG